MGTRSGSTPGSDAGFTLIELMVTLVIASILLSIAVPSYMNQIRKSRRTEARNAVLDLATREERFLSTSNTYSQVTTDLGYSGAFPQTVGSGYYTLTVRSPDPAFVGPAGAPSYIVTATAVGTQVRDSACASFSVNQIGQQTSVDSGGANSTATCWAN